MKYKYKAGDLVEVRHSETETLSGLVVGCMTVDIPVIGNSWAIEDLSGKFPSHDYPFKIYAAFGSQLTKKE